MKYVRAIVVGVALMAGASALANAQNVLSVQWQDSDDRQAFREGYRRGQWDAQHGRRADWDDNRWREADDRRAFREGYLRGYREAGFDRDGDRDDGYDNRGYYGAGAARRFGYQDGYNDGLNDRRTGHSYRPTHDSNYHHADRGYNRSFGSKGYYKQVYRQAYEEGYSRGYNTNPWYRR
jgi:hypothetical protein